MFEPSRKHTTINYDFIKSHPFFGAKLIKRFLAEIFELFLIITNYHGVPEGKSMIIIFYWMDADAYHGFGLVGSRRMGPLGCAASQGFRGRSRAIETALRLNPNCQHSAPLKLSLSST